MMREGWYTDKLGSFVIYEKGKKPARLQNKSNDIYKYPYIDIEAFEKGIIKKYTDGEKSRFCTESDILMVWDGSRSGLVGKGVNGALGSTLMRINFSYINNDYAFYFLKSKYNEINSRPKGTGTPHVDPNLLWNYDFPVAPLTEQQAIVQKIEELFSKLDNGIANLKKAKEKLEIYRQAVLKKAFEGELTKEWRKKNLYTMEDFLSNLKQEKENAMNSKLISRSDYFPSFREEDLTYKTPGNWITLPWKTITKNDKYAMKRGPFGSALKKEYFVDEGIVVYEQGHAINDDPYRHRYFITKEKFEELKAFQVKGGDMIISCSGVTLGRICLLPEDADIGVINQALLKIDLDENIMLKEFFILLFRSETFQRLIFKKSLGTAMPNMVGMTELKEIPIPVPSIEEQRQIIYEIETRLSVCDNILANIEEGLEKAEALRQSILKKAFEGKLLNEKELAACRKEPDWEPAEKLLERINQ